MFRKLKWYPKLFIGQYFHFEKGKMGGGDLKYFWLKLERRKKIRGKEWCRGTKLKEETIESLVSCCNERKSFPDIQNLIIKRVLLSALTEILLRGPLEKFWL